MVKDSYEKLTRIFSLYDDDISVHLYELNHMISSLKDMDEIQTSVNDIYYSLQDTMERLRSMFDDTDLSEEEINEMEEQVRAFLKGRA